jgi:hypothetical protein
MVGYETFSTEGQDSDIFFSSLGMLLSSVRFFFTKSLLANTDGHFECFRLQG